MRKTTAIPLFLCAVLILLFSSCAPEPRVPTVEMPVKPDCTDRITTIAPDAPYLPEGGETASDWPTRPITIIVPFLPGGTTNMYARMIAPRLANELGQPVYVMNVDGGSGTFGANAVKATIPDGYTVLFYQTGNMFANVLTGAAEVNYHDFDVAAITMHCYANVLVIHRDLGINTADEFLAHIRAYPTGLRVAAVIPGFSYMQLRFAEAAGGFITNPIHVGGGSMMAPSVLAGHADMAYNNIALFIDHIKSGELIPLWVAADERNILLPDVPTMAEAGIEGGFTGRSYFLGFPLGTDEEILRRVSNAVRNITQEPDFIQLTLDTVGLPAFFVPYGETSDYLSQKWVQFAGMGEYQQ